MLSTCTWLNQGGQPHSCVEKKKKVYLFRFDRIYSFSLTQVANMKSSHFGLYAASIFVVYSLRYFLKISVSSSSGFPVEREEH